MSQDKSQTTSNTTNTPTTRVERVVVWEGEWAPVRRFFHQLFVLKDTTIREVNSACETTSQFIQKTKRTVNDQANKTKRELCAIQKTYPQYIIPAAGLLAALLPAKSKLTRFRNFILGSAFISATLYPKYFVSAFYKPKELFEQTFVLIQQQIDSTSSNPTTPVITSTNTTTSSKPSLSSSPTVNYSTPIKPVENNNPLTEEISAQTTPTVVETTKEEEQKQETKNE
ncbi:hypothetical protein ABK040_016743 [Willaertia magna]